LRTCDEKLAQAEHSNKKGPARTLVFEDKQDFEKIPIPRKSISTVVTPITKTADTAITVAPAYTSDDIPTHDKAISTVVTPDSKNTESGNTDELVNSSDDDALALSEFKKKRVAQMAEKRAAAKKARG
jgi:hypothetical protein